MSLISSCYISDKVYHILMSAIQRTKEEEEDLKFFSDKLRRARTLNGLSQESMAHKAGFSRSYYTELETGKRNPSFLSIMKILKVLKVEATDLITFPSKDL